MNKQDYYVYIHKDEDGNVRYVGSGRRDRYKSPSNRSKEHLKMFNSLEKIIIVCDLTKNAAIEIENELIKTYDNGSLFNIIKTVGRVKSLNYQELNEVFYYDETSPSCLRHKIKKKRVLAGDVAGRLDSKGYWVVKFKSVPYLVHRIVVVLSTGKDIAEGMVVDHIDGIPSNNIINNLRVISQKENSRNLTFDSDSIKRLYWIENGYQCRWRVYYMDDNHNRRSKSFNPRKLYPDIPLEDAKELSKALALEYLELTEELYYSFQYNKVCDIMQ